MAIGLLTVLRMVPWGDVINNAPKIADGAMKLWRSVARKPPAAEPAASDAQPALSPEGHSLAILQEKLAAAETEIAVLHNQMLESSDLIKALAEQNTQLIKRIEVNRIRVQWLAGGMVILAVVAAINLGVVLAR